MIVGIGNDIIEIERFENISEKFLKKVYTSKELKSTGIKKNRLAGGFAAKEAVAKALGTGFSNISPADIEILRDEKGKPFCNLLGNSKIIAEDKCIDNIHISISHCRLYAAAVAVAEKREL